MSLPPSKLPRGQMVEHRPLIPAFQEGDRHEVYPHSSTDMVVGTPLTINIPRPVRWILVQAVDQNIRYVLAGTPSQTSGFVLTAGNDPIGIPVIGGQTILTFTAEAAGARLEMQFCQ